MVQVLDHRITFWFHTLRITLWADMEPGDHRSPLQDNIALCVNFIAPLLNCNR